MVGFFLVWPKYQSVSLIKSKIDEKKKELKYRGEYFVHIKSLHDELNEHKVNLSKIDSALPEELSLAALYSYIQKTVAENGLVLKNTGFTVPKRSSLAKDELKVQEIHFSLVLSGSYPAFKNFIFSLENSARLWEVESFNLSSVIASERISGEEPREEGSGAKKEPVFSFNLRIKTHSY